MKKISDRQAHWLLLLLLVPFYCFSIELTPMDNTPYTGDFDVMEEKGVVRVLVSADLGFYYIEGGKPKGLLAELLNHFETKLRHKSSYLHLQVIPVEREDLIPALLAGRGDIIAANLTITESRKREIDFSLSLLKDVSEFLVTSKDKEDITTLEHLSGKEIWVRPSSSYFEHVTQINRLLSDAKLPPMRVHFLESALQDYEIIDMVNQGHIYSTILDSHKSELWLNVMENIKIHTKIPFHQGGEIAWAYRKNSPKLEALVNQYLKKARFGTLLGNVLYEKYIKKTNWLSRAVNPKKTEKFHALSDVFKKYGDQYEIDWVMLAAQAFQESGLDNSKVSHRGAVGIMQVLPSTAKDHNVNIEDIKKLDNNVHAGTKYMRFIKDRYFSEGRVSPEDQVYFSLAAYNAGPANIRKMRTLAKKHGYNPDIWFKNVEIIARRNIGKEPVHYVANINRYYTIYKQLLSINEVREEQNAKLVELVAPEN